MTGFQKAIKVVAIVFAISLTATIIGGIVNLAGFFINGLTGGDGKTTENFSEAYEEDGIEGIKIESSYGRLVIKSGDGFLVEADGASSRFSSRVSNSGILVITNTGGNYNWAGKFFGGDDEFKDAVITVTVPEKFEVESLEIENGFGDLIMQDVACGFLKLKLGAGDCDVIGVKSGRTDIDAGVGELSFIDVVLGNVNLNCGVGDISIEGIMTGENDVDCGVGEIDIRIEGNREDYDISVERGIGEIYLDGEKQDDMKAGDSSAENTLNINGGIGEVSVKFTETE
ncbi:DUF4097 family beta strand repeat-containing protein [Anaerobium acetethylicum]|uniref:Putative adhesin n=1 Tax=Anaerobium acetethylicum TaxID=1619234 RepID=A0A1D3TT21_9FIRM|nr:DUF4097 family beta strand repeat-containing protein [Anaerobium acetethylicum]SCP97080.1 Putative adhesin [Anaerobium acetethylicum]